MWPFTRERDAARRIAEDLSHRLAEAKQRLVLAEQDRAATERALELTDARVKRLTHALAQAHFRDPKTGRLSKKGVVPVGLV